MAAQREWYEKDYYKVLGVSDSASQKEITKAYRKLARQYHPDQNPDDKAAEERFKEISAAYDVIGDPGKRKEYDEVRALGPMGGMFGGGGTGPGGFSFRAEDLGDMFSSVFSRATRRGGGPSRGQGPQRGRDLEAELHLAFEDAAKGVTTSVNLTSDVACSSCHGTGAKPGTTPHMCAVCNGRGVLDENQGFFSFSQPCQACAGRGIVIEEPCPTCHGSGVEHRPRQVKVRIPAGVSDGQRIRLKGRGTPGANGGPNGDLYVITRVAPHPLFGRTGRNLTLTVPVTYPEAVLGAKITVPTLDGGPVTLKVPAGTRSGRTFRVKGRGSRATTAAATCSSPSRWPCRATSRPRNARRWRRWRRPARRRLGRTWRQPMPDDPRHRELQALYVISVAAELAGVHPQTLRIYERKGLVDPARTGGGSRRYSDADIAQLRRIQELTNDGLNLAGVKMVLELEAQIDRLRAELADTREQAATALEQTHRQYRRDLVPVKQSIVLYRGRP